MLLGLLVMSLWNALLPAILGVKAIGFWQALGILVLSRILFGVPHSPEEEYLKTLLWDERGQALSELPLLQREVFEKTEH